jgi:hypothetical protein
MLTSLKVTDKIPHRKRRRRGREFLQILGTNVRSDPLTSKTEYYYLIILTIIK